MSNPCWVYILTNHSGCYYVGMTGNPLRRWQQHIAKQGAVFSGEYNVKRLVYLRECPDRRTARRHEVTVKRLNRKRKLALIRQFNPRLEDLSVVFGWRAPSSGRSMRRRLMSCE